MVSKVSVAPSGQESTTEATCLGDLWALYAVCEEAWLLGRITKQEPEEGGLPEMVLTGTDEADRTT